MPPRSTTAAAMMGMSVQSGYRLHDYPAGAACAAASAPPDTSPGSLLLDRAMPLDRRRVARLAAGRAGYFAALTTAARNSPMPAPVSALVASTSGKAATWVRAMASTFANVAANSVGLILSALVSTS